MSRRYNQYSKNGRPLINGKPVIGEKNGRPVIDELCSSNLKGLARFAEEEAKIFLNWLLKGKSNSPYCMDPGNMAKQVLNEERALKEAKKSKAFSASKISSKGRSQKKTKLSQKQLVDVGEQGVETSPNLDQMVINSGEKTIASQAQRVEQIEYVKPGLYNVTKPTQVNLQLLQFLANLQKEKTFSSPGLSLNQAEDVNIFNQQRSLNLSQERLPVSRFKNRSSEIPFYIDSIKLTLKEKNFGASPYNTLIQQPEFEEYSNSYSNNTLKLENIQVLLLTLSLIANRKLIKRILAKAELGKRFQKRFMAFRKKAKSLFGFTPKMKENLNQIFLSFFSYLLATRNLVLRNLENLGENFVTAFCGGEGTWIFDEQARLQEEQERAIYGKKPLSDKKKLILWIVFLAALVVGIGIFAFKMRHSNILLASALKKAQKQIAFEQSMSEDTRMAYRMKNVALKGSYGKTEKCLEEKKILEENICYLEKKVADCKGLSNKTSNATINKPAKKTIGDEIKPAMRGPTGGEIDLKKFIDSLKPEDKSND